MKLYFTPQYTEDLSRFSDSKLESFGIFSREYSQTPILITNLALEKNSKGQLVITFDSENHKYLKCQYGITSAGNIDNDFVENPFLSRGLEIETECQYEDDKFSDGVPSMLPVSYMTIWFEAESKEEEQMLDGYAYILPTKYSYSIVIIPWDVFDVNTKDEDKIVNIDEQMVYFFEFN